MCRRLNTMGRRCPAATKVAQRWNTTSTIPMCQLVFNLWLAGKNIGPMGCTRGGGGARVHRLDGGHSDGWNGDQSGRRGRGFELVELARLLEAASAGRHSSEITIGQPVTLDMNIGVWTRWKVNIWDPVTRVGSIVVDVQRCQSTQPIPMSTSVAAISRIAAPMRSLVTIGAVSISFFFFFYFFLLLFFGFVAIDIWR